MSTETNPASDGGGHALVIGGSMAGLLAARVLSERFGRVTLVERDHFPERPRFRKGVPQSRHLHAFMMRGRLISERLLARPCGCPRKKAPGHQGDPGPHPGGPSGPHRSRSAQSRGGVSPRTKRVRSRGAGEPGAVPRRGTRRVGERAMK